MRQWKKPLAAVAAALALALAVVPADAAPEAMSLEDLLQEVRAGNRAEEELNRKREAEFQAAKSQQEKMLADALAKEKAAIERSEALELQFEENENALPELEATLRNRLGTLGELFGVVRQVAGDTRSRVEASIISAQLPGRDEFLAKLAASRELPSIADLEKLWMTLQEQMTEQGRVVSFPATVVSAGGSEQTQQVTRIGPFNVVSQGRYLQFLPGSGQLAELGRQPASRYLASVERFEAARDGMAGIAIDPSRGSLLSMLIQSPDLEERVQQGGAVGYVIIVLGALGLALAAYRTVVLMISGARIRAQLGKDKADAGNALGRVLAVYERNRNTDIETLELRLEEAIIQETSKLQRGTTLIKVLSVIAPLLGLLGTVTGMILTFQQITLFGTGDPKLMAGGISQALVTTVLGLVMAIPLTLLYSMISERAKNLILILEEQSVGMVAEQAERLKAQEG